MFAHPTSHKRLPVILTACLLSVALPVSGLAAKEKNKGTSKPAAEMTTSYEVSIPSIDAPGSNLGEDVLRDILSGNISAHADALSALDADSISVPEMVVTITSTQDDETYTASFTLSDLRLENVEDGVATSVSLAGIDMTTDEADANFGALSAANFNIGGMLGVYGLVDSMGQTEMQTIYTDLTAVGGSIEAEDVSCTIGPVAGDEFKARPLRTSFAEIMALADKASDVEDDMDPALLGQVMRIYADFLTAFETSEVTFGGLSCEGEDSDGRPMTFDIASMVMGGMSPGLYPSISIDGFSVVVEGDGSMTLDNFTFKPMDLSSVIATLESAPELIDETWLEANARALIPAMEGFSMSGLDIDVPDPEDADARIAAAVGAFDLSLADYFNGIPTKVDTSAQNIQVALPEDSEDETVVQMRALGITDIDMGFRLAAAWDEATDSIAVEDVSLSGVDLGSILLAGTITNATSDLFAIDENTTRAAAMSLAVKTLNLTVTDDGISDIMLAAIAAEQGTDAATLRPVFAGIAQGTVLGVMAGAADAAKLGEAVNQFMSGNARTLQIGLDAKEEPGLSLLELAAASDDPSAILNKVNVSAEAK